MLQERIRSDDKMPIVEQAKAEYRATVNLQSFKDRDEVKAEIRDCGLTAAVFTYACFIFAALGVIGDALNMTLGLETISWLLLAIVFAISAIVPNMRSIAAKHLYGIESERKKE